VQRDWAFGGLKGVKSQWSVAGREAPGRTRRFRFFLPHRLPLTSNNGSSLEQDRAVSVWWNWWIGGCRAAFVSTILEPTLAVTADGEALIERLRVGDVM
jgi:hypothetical protein